MKKILIIGKRGFLGNNLSKYLKRFHSISHISFKNLDKLKHKINSFDYVINTSINKSYIEKKYNDKFDNDLKIANLIMGNTIFIFLSTRKIYKTSTNVKENDKLDPKTNYAKNKLISEKKLFKKLRENLIILRISNIIGNKDKTKRLHNTFIDIFFHNIKKGFVIDSKKDFKDFISVEKFCEIVTKIIQKNLFGVYNVSIGQKIYLNEIVKWLNQYNKKKFTTKKRTTINECFFLNNKKLMSKIKIKNSKLELKKYCLKISKERFLSY